jgi:IS605 OrfB family transposase
MDEKENRINKNEIIEFLKECQQVENQLLKYYWEHFNIIIPIKSSIGMTYIKDINYKDTIPRLKSHHFYTVLKQAYEQLKSVQVKIIKKIHFKMEDKELQRIYNYCSKFCFDWKGLDKYIKKQLTKYKQDDIKYYNFLKLVNEYINIEENYIKLKIDIETEFYKIKSEYNLPIKKNFQIRCDTFLTATIDKSNCHQWIFFIDNNIVVGGSERKSFYGNMKIPVKYSNYHSSILEHKELKNTFNIKLNKYGKIEIIGFYEINIDKIEPCFINKVGIDIGLKKLITCSDGEIVEQNPKLIYKAEKLMKTQSNRDNLEKHLRKKYNEENYILSNKNYLRRQAKLTHSVNVDNRYKIKQFLKGREQDHIIMEDLDIGYSKTFSKKVNYLLRRMHIQEIKNDMLNYCGKFGIEVSLVNPAFTSQQCSKCGYISKENRKTQEKFLCVKCGYEINADYNASINIMNRHGDNRINLNTPYWRAKEILNVT